MSRAAVRIGCPRSYASTGADLPRAGASKLVILTLLRGVVLYSYARMEDELRCVRERGRRS